MASGQTLQAGDFSDSTIIFFYTVISVGRDIRYARVDKRRYVSMYYYYYYYDVVTAYAIILVVCIPGTVWPYGVKFMGVLKLYRCARSVADTTITAGDYTLINNVINIIVRPCARWILYVIQFVIKYSAIFAAFFFSPPLIVEKTSVSQVYCDSNCFYVFSIKFFQRSERPLEKIILTFKSRFTRTRR